MAALVQVTPKTLSHETVEVPKSKPKKRRRHKVSIFDLFFLGVILVGLGFIFYPTVADLWNKYVSANAARAYDRAVQAVIEGSGFATDEEGNPIVLEGGIDGEVGRAGEYNQEIAEQASTRYGQIAIDMDLQKMLDSAMLYNEELVETSPNLINPNMEEYEERDRYLSLLNPLGDGMMGYVSIDSIDVNLPIYHGTSETELQTGVGHLVGSSLPIGGPSTHTVLAGHSGLPSARLFTDLEDLRKGDIFVITTLGMRLGYEVDSMDVVLPEDVHDLKIEEGEDYATLVTCTPYGINSHRLLVRGHRVDLPPEELDALVDGAAFPWVWAALLAFGAFDVVVFGILIIRRRSRDREERASAKKREALRG